MIIVIPARYASTRLPGKPLADIAGKPLIQHVHERARESGAGTIVIATDDERIRKAAESFGARVCMTRAEHRSGTERLAEVIAMLAIPPDEIVVNLQGDEPQMPPALIQQTAGALARHADAVVATACTPLLDEAELRNPNMVKVVFDCRGYALYFSRAPIPFPRDGGLPPAYRHIGLYAYRAGYVANYVRLEPSPHELAEQLEQLRVLWHGGRIAVHVTDQAPPAGVDTPEDLDRVRKLFR
jgi:3-deoxy-manno-octulosonate cytidylyltransferase (CMP-KDO synthetase)